MIHLEIGNYITLSIHGLGHSGEGVGSYSGYTVFVQGALPGEVVTACLYERKKSYGRASLIKVVQPSPHRVKPVCSSFGRCGGCQLMHLDYPEQLKLKQKKVLDALQRIGKISDVSVEPCAPSPNPLHYRNKIQLPVQATDHGLVLGLYALSSHDLVEVDTCHIHSSLGEEIFQKIKKLIQQSEIKAYDLQTGKGELRHVLIKTSVHLEEVLVIFVTREDSSKYLPSLARQVMQCSPIVKGVVHNVNRECNNVILGDRYHLLAGSYYIRERLGSLIFNISPASFFQVNVRQAECLYGKALEFAEVSGRETVLDAYCGVGTISLFFANHVKKVIGVECVPMAIDDAKENARLNGISNVEFVCAHAEDYIKKLEDAIDIMVVNPPRKGCEKSFLEAVHRLKPQKIIYISCDPATLARDLAFLCNDGYSIQGVQPFDMFPQTAHVETIVKLTRVLN